MALLRSSNRKRRIRKGDSNMIATFDLNYTPQINTLKSELLRRGYKLHIRDGIKTLEKDGDVIKI